MEYLGELRKVEVSILDEICRICSEHNLEYFLIAGTLLGAVRHKGFIPWDDDIDVAMPRESFEKFLNICQNGGLNSAFYLHSKETDREYWLSFPKVRKKNTIFDEAGIEHMDVPKGIYVDVFPLDDTHCVVSLEKKIRALLIKHISAVICVKKGIRLNSKLQERLYFPFCWIPTIWLTEFQSKLMQKENGGDAQYYVNYASRYNAIVETMPKSAFSPACRLEFEGKQYNCPNNWDYVLTRVYGPDYMQLPPPEKRITHRPVRICFDVEGSVAG